MHSVCIISLGIAPQTTCHRAGWWTLGVLKLGFGRDVPLRNLKVDPYKYQSLKEKPTHSYTDRPKFGPNFWAKSRDFSRIFLNLSQFGLKFRKFLKNLPIHISNFAFYEGHPWPCAKRLILLPMLVARLHRVFCTEYPPWPRMENSVLFYLQYAWPVYLLNPRWKHPILRPVSYTPVHLVESVENCELCMMRRYLACSSYTNVMHRELAIMHTLRYDTSARD